MEEVRPKIFDFFVANKIYKLYALYPVNALQELKYYLEDYPNDYIAHTMYVKFLTNLKLYEEAEQEIENIRSLVFSFDKYLKYYSENDLINGNNRLIISELKILLHKKKYIDALHLLCNNWKVFLNSKHNPDVCLYFLLERLGIKVQEINKNNNYIYNQILNYNYDSFLDHIKMHIISDDSEINEKSKFYKDFPIEEVLEEVKKYIPSSKCQNLELLTDVYLFKYDNNGITNRPTNYAHKGTNFFKVIVFHGTNEFITMYPVSYQHSNFYIDLGYLADKKLTKYNVKK